MTPVRQPMSAALPLRGKGERTPHADVREVPLLAQGSGTAPRLLSAPERPPDFLHRNNGDGRAPASRRLGSRGRRCCYQHGLPRAWHPLSLRRAHTAPRLPAVLRLAEGRRLLPAAPPGHPQVDCTTGSRWGLRRHAALSRPVSALDGQRLPGPGPCGKGAQDRAVPRPAAPLARRRSSWQPPRHKPGRFPATGRTQPPRPPAPSPRRRARGQGACRPATPRAGSTTRSGAIQPRRPASAPPLLAAGIQPRRLQRSLGPPPLDTTRGSCPLPHPGHDEASERRNSRRHGGRP
jgi:hypothetical protein